MTEFDVAGQRVRPLEILVDGDVPLEVLQLAAPESALEGAIRGERDPYAGILWPSSIAAARALVSYIRPGMHVVDVGAGTGLISLAAARRGARVLALDHDAVALQLIAAAAARQGLDVETMVFDLTSSRDLPPAELFVFSDLLYQRDFSLMVAGRAVEALRQHATVIVADPGRIGRDAFVTAIAAHGMAADFVESVVAVPGEDRNERIGICLLRHK